MTLVRSSTVSLYLRLFSINKRFVIAASILLALIVGWGIATTLVGIFQCQPVSAGWDYDKKHIHCIKLDIYIMTTNILSIIIDVGTLSLPIPMVWQLLHVSTPRKMGITGIFLLGAS